MNRIPHSAMPADATPFGLSPVEPAPVVSSALYVPVRGEQPMALFAPLHYELNYAYPLVVWLHGASDSEQQLRRVMPEISLRNYMGVAVRGAVETTNANGRQAYSWSQSRADVAMAEQAVADAIATASDRYNINPSRIFLAGFDCGGTMALRLALAQPRRFAGVLSLLGEVPSDRTPLVRWHELRGLPVFMAAGRRSLKYPTTTVCDNLRLLHTAGVTWTLREYPVAHELSLDMLGDINRWMMERIAG